MREELRAEVTDAFIFQTLEDQVPLSLNEPCLDIDAFVKFVGILHEFADRDRYLQFQSILQKYSIGSQVEAQWQHDLVELHSQFHEYDPVSGKYGSSTGSLSEKQAMTVMRESGYMPKSELRQQKTVEMVEEATRVEGTLGFMEFLNIMYKLREYDRERLRRLFETRNNWAHGTLTLADIYEVLPMAGLIPRSNDEKHEVTAIIEEFDEDGLGIVSCDECLTVLQMLDRKFRLMQRERERQYVISAGWSESNFAEFREAFWSFDEDMSEVLERDELMKAVEMLRGSFWQSSSNMNLMLVALGIDPTKEIQVNFLMFLRMLKMLDDTESRRQQGLLMGFPQERTDTLYTIFQALEPESDGTVGRELLQQVVLQVLRDLPKIQLDDVTRMLSQEPLQVEFGAFLRLMKSIDGFQEVNFDDCVREMFNLADNANSGVI
jgi:Ca2+-binding EF-hand superfamily protein